MNTKRPANPRINLITLGCSKNLVDSENLLTQLRGNELDARHESSRPADIAVINTCGFIDRAKEESIETILAAVAQKAAGELAEVYVTGCLSERYRDELQADMPEVDGFFGTMELPGLLQRLGADYKHELIGERQPTTDGHYAYLKIAEGCDRPCSFCAIPLMRGKHRSRPMEELVEEARFLVSRGRKELMLIAQDLTYYGIDRYGERRLAQLLEALAGVEGLAWIRLHYAFPSGFPEDVLPVIHRHPNICNYLDMPLQHASDKVLKAMRRGITRRKTEALIERIRTAVPGIALRTTMMVGYPGETEADFEELMDFVRQARFERLGVFTYSHEEGTHAYRSEDDVPEDDKQARADALMALQEDISHENNQRLEGRRLTVLVDRHEGGRSIARTEYDSPEVDNEVLIDASLPIGRFAEVVIDRADSFDLHAHVPALQETA